MPRNYKRKSDRQNWSTLSMEKAIEAVSKNEMGWQRASKIFGVPQATLRRHALKQNKILEPKAKGLGRYKTTFTAEMERQLVEHLKLLETRLFGFTCQEVQRLAFQFAEKNGIKNNFNKESKKAGQEWLAGFRQRNKDISLRKPEATSAARAQAFNRPQVERFFTVLQEIVDKNKIRPFRMYNVDESALSTVQRPQKIFATTGRKQVGALTSAEKGSHVTVVCCMSASGNYVPPCLIFPRKLMKNELIDEAPTGTLGIAQESGWMTTNVFYKWLVHFQSHVKASLEDKVLLIVDGHISHKGIESLSFAKDNGIILLCLPPHCTHRMQPLDVSFYGPLKAYFNQEISTWLKAHPGRVVTQFQIGSLFEKAYGKAATIHNAVNGFKKTGLWPVDPNFFPDYMYEPSETTNIPLQAAIENTQNPTPSTSGVTIANQDQTSVSIIDDSLIISEVSDNSGIVKFPVEVLSPVPKGTYVAGQGKRKPKKRQTELVLTSTPNMEEVKSKSAPAPTKKPKKRKATRVLNLSSGSENEDPVVQVEEDEDDCACIYCNDLYSRSKPREIWLKCLNCAKWAHASCADVPKKNKIICL